MTNRYHYIKVEVSPKRGLAVGSAEGGSFNKLDAKHGQLFLWIRKNQHVLKAFNLDFFNIVMTECFDGAIRRFTFFQPKYTEQKIARAHVKKLEAGMVPEWPPKLEEEKSDNKQSP